MQNLSTKKIYLTIIAIALPVVFGFAIFSAFGGTTINKTLNTNPNLSTGLVGHWTFDGPDTDWTSSGAEILDMSGNSNSGDAINLDKNSVNIGKIGQSLDFNGSNDYINIADSNELDLNDFTISAWVLTRSSSGIHQIMAKGSGSPISQFFQSGTQLRIQVVNTTSILSSTYFDSAHQNTWVYVTVTWDGSNVVTYRDGLEISTISNSDIPSSNTVSLFVGRWWNGGEFWNGKMDDVRIYNRALSASEITRFYQLGGTTRINKTLNTNPNLSDGLVGHWSFDGKDMNPNVRDISGQGNHGNLSGQTSTTTTVGKIGQALDFDGVDDYVDLDDAFFNIPQRSVSLWFKASVLGDEMVFAGGDNTPNRWYMWLQSDGTIDTRIGSNSAKTSSIGYSVGEWTHYVVTYDVIRAKAYINASLGSDESNTSLSGSGRVNIGSYADGNSSKFNGSIDDVRIYNRALSASEITRLYQLGGTTRINKTLNTNPNLSDGLVGHWSFDGATATGIGAWYDPDYQYKRTLTLNNSQIATTTTNGYAILATTTLSTLSATTTGGNVEFLDGRDIIFVDSTNTKLLDYHLESYATSTGQITAWIEVDDMSSTTDKTFNIYYGNPNATDKSNEAGVYNSTYAGVWDMSEDPAGTSPQMLDSTGNNNDGTSIGSMTATDQVDGQVNGALDFDGSNDYILASNSASLTFGSGSNFSFATWIKTASFQSSGSKFIEKKISLGESIVMHAYPSDNLADFGARDSNGISGGVKSTTLLNDNQWHYVVGTKKGNTLSVYVDGILEGTNTVSFTGNWNDGDVRIGTSVDGGSRYVDGQLDNARIYNIAIDPMDILTDYNMSSDNTSFLSWGAEIIFGGTVNDTSGQNNTGTVKGAQKTLGKIGQALQFDAVDDYVDLGSDTSIDTVFDGGGTITAWINPNSAGEGSGFGMIMGKEDSGGNNGWTSSVETLVAGKVQLQFKHRFSSGSGKGQWNTTVEEVPIGEWSHVVFLYDADSSANDPIIYVNGVSVGITEGVSPAGTRDTDAAANLLVGSNIGTSRTWDGKIDDVRIYNRTLSALEISQLYNLGR